MPVPNTLKTGLITWLVEKLLNTLKAVVLEKILLCFGLAMVSIHTTKFLRV